MTSDDVVKILRRTIDRSGKSQRQWAKDHGLSPAYVSDVLIGRRPPADVICAAIGIKRQITYARVKHAA